MAKQSRKNESGRRPAIALIGLAAFVILDIGLVAFALSTTRASGDRVPETLPTLFTSSPSATPTPSPINTVPASAPLLVATSATAAWRSTVGGCDGTDAVIENTADGGATWTPQSSGAVAIHQVLSLTADSDSHVTVVGKAGTGCATGVFSSFTAGQFWQSYPDQLAAQTYVDSANPATIVQPSGPLASPCAEVAQPRLVNNQAVVLCDGALHQYSADAADWLSLPAPDAVAIAPADAGLKLAVAGSADCPGIAIESVELPLSGEAPTVVGCAADVAPTDAVSISQSGQSVWLWSGDVTTVSTDGGVSW